MIEQYQIAQHQSRIDSASTSRLTVIPGKHMLLVGRIWHYRFCVAGVRVQRTTRERDQGRAEQVAQRAYEDACTVANGGKIIPTLATLVDDWLEVHDRVMSVSHILSVRVFKRCHLYNLGALPISELSTERVELARNMHLATHSPATTNQWLRILKLTVNWAVRREILSKLPWCVSMIKLQRKPRVTLSLALAKDWFAALDEAAQDRSSISTAVRLMFGLGLRASEAAGARWEWIDWERRTYTPGATKGREAVAIPMPQWIADRLGPARASAGLIAGGRKGKQMPPGFALRAIYAANTACGISGITPHRLRGSFATLLAEEGTPVQTIQQVMRHKDVKTTISYLEVNLETAALAQERLGEKMGFGTTSRTS